MKPVFYSAISAILITLAAPAALAQSTQTAGRVGQVGGACGQPLGLTYTLPLALDLAAMAPLAADLVRAEPMYLEFSLTAETRVVFRTETSDAEADPYLTVFSTTGEVLGEDDDAAGGYNAVVDLTLPAGTYCAQMQPYAAAANGTVPMTMLVATGEAADALAARVDPEVGLTDVSTLCTDPSMMAEAVPDLGPGFGALTLGADVPNGARRDFVLNVAEAMDFQADVVSSSFDTILTLARDGAFVAENDDGMNMGTDSRIAVTLEPGSYCLSVSGFDSGGGAAQLTLTDEPEFPILGDITTACSDPAQTNDFGTALAPGIGVASVAGVMAMNARSAWTVEVTAATLFQLDARSQSFDPVLSLVDAEGTLLEQNDDGNGTGTDSRIVRVLEPGRYCLAVEALGGGEGAFDLAVSDTPDPEPVDLGAIQPCTVPEMTADLGTVLAPGFGAVSLPLTLAANARQDWMVTVSAPVELRFDAKSGAFDTLLKLNDMVGVPIAENDDAPLGGTDSTFETPLTPGTYCLSLEGFAGAGGAAEVAVTELDAATLDKLAVDRGTVPPAPDSGVEIEELGPLQTVLQANRISADETKWIAFDLDAEAEVRIDAVSVSGDFALRLFSPTGEVLNETSGFAGLSPTTLSQRVPAGRYMIGMTLTNASGTRLRSVTITRAGAP